MSDKDDKVIKFPLYWEAWEKAFLKKDEPLWLYVIRNEYSENFEALIVTATSRKTGKSASYGQFPNQAMVDDFIEKFEFDLNGYDDVDEDTLAEMGRNGDFDDEFDFVVSKYNQIRAVVEEQLDYEKDKAQMDKFWSQFIVGGE